MAGYTEMSLKYCTFSNYREAQWESGLSLHFPPVGFHLSAGQTYVSESDREKTGRNFFKVFFLKEQRLYFVHFPTLSSQLCFPSAGCMNIF